MRRKHILLLLLINFVISIAANAQEPRAPKNVRYVTTSGKYANDGLTWATAKNNVQDAINDLVNKGLTGEVWVAKGIYKPTESTESSGGSTLYMSFKVPAGITLRGGFFGPGRVPGESGAANAADSLEHFKNLLGDVYVNVHAADGNTVTKEGIQPGDFFPGEDYAEQRALYVTQHNNLSSDSIYPYISTLSGDLSQEARFEWNSVKKYWNAQFYGNCYHVVWFATNGFNADGRARAIDTSKGEAIVEGFTITNGNARNNNLSEREHNAYGGGVYMVQGSRLQNCRITQCEASRDGGGIYMDGGGIVTHCYISNCQAIGTGAQNGYGGGVCLETNKNVTDTRMGMYRSVINGCVGRLGGGAAIKTEKANGPDGKDLRNKIFLSASAIYNNTATTEAGGLYMLGGGAISNITITRNQCNGSGIISNGMVTGRAGGLYCRDRAVVFNSVLWGNECRSNSDLQFASSQSSADPDLKIEMKFCAVALSDFTDWSNTAKEGIFNISSYNTAADRAAAGATASENDVFPHFNSPSPNAGYVDIKPVLPADTSLTHTQRGLHYYYDWQPATNSCLANAGILALDLNPDGTLPFNSLYNDIIGYQYNPRPTIGGYTRMFGRMTAWERTGTSGTEYHFFVDPDASSSRPIDELEHGISWTQPARFISNVLYSIYNEPTDKYKNGKVFIHVKQGTLNNTNSYVTFKRVREMTIGVRSDNLVIQGGYPRQLTERNFEQTIDGVKYARNPLRYPTFITGKITDDYHMNASHLMQFDNCKNVEFDGFQIRYANASSTLFDASGNDGGAIRLINGAQNIRFRNLIIAGNTADRGAAVFAETNTSATFENVIFHNNESKKALRGTERQGIIHTLGTASLDFKHCNFLNNVGHPGYLEDESTQHFENSIFFANCSEPVTQAYGDSVMAKLLPSFEGNTAGATGSYCFFDAHSAAFKDQFGGEVAKLAPYQYNLSYVLNGDGFPRFINGVHNVGVSQGGDETFYGRSTSFEPHNENPMVNTASYSGAPETWGYDISTITPRTYGGLPDIGAIENHASDTDEEGENAYPGGQQPYGSVVYVRDYHTYEGQDRIATDFETSANGTARDGSSWENAINGNATYGEYTPATPDTYESIDIATAVNEGIRVRMALVIEDDMDNTLGYIKGNNANTTSLVGAGELAENGDEFIITGSGTSYQIRHVSSNKYLRNRSNNYNYTFNLNTSTNYSTWSVSGNETDGYQFYCTNNRGTRYYLGASSNTTSITVSQSSNTNNLRYTWKLTRKVDGTPATSRETLGLRYAIEKANAAWVTDHQVHDVYVGAGLYTDNIVMLEGVNVLGGFPRTGNPGENERDISNKTPGYMTFIDGNRAGRTLTQEGDFDIAETMFEGFIIQNGLSTGTEYGAGVHLRKNGIIKNCLIINNQFNAVSSSAAGGGGVYINNGGLVKNSTIKQNILRNTSNNKIGGAGVHSNGGNLQNSLIVENTAYTTGINVLGAGFYISALSNLYNCTIAYNVGNNTNTDNPTNGQIGGTPCTGGVWDASAGSQGKSQFYNCIIWGNYATGTTKENYFQVGMSGFSSGGGIANDAFHQCYSSAADATSASDTWSDENLVCHINTSTAANNYPEFYRVCREKEPFLRKADGSTDYELKPTATQCINRGKNIDILESLEIFNDIVGHDRVIDCSVDKGAYEYNDAYAITPSVTHQKDAGGNDLTDGSGNKLVDETKPATFYVTPDGSGLASGSDPSNAACARKLQRVLDAAGRYKYQHPRQQVIVKVAARSTVAAGDAPFQYYATRTTDETDANVRIWSIIVPRGVEVWGGYTDAYTSNNDNGFYKNTVSGGVVTKSEDQRDITAHPTIFDSHYYSNELAGNVNCYHVITFTDKVFDGEGKPYMVGDRIGTASSYGKTAPIAGETPLNEPAPASTSTFLLMSDAPGNEASNNPLWGNVTDRAVIDGIYITSGQADLQSFSSGSQTVNINRYGGAAIVTDYAHVRNCIVRNNRGVCGGALALTHNALVSGCLIDQNTAEYGGAIYVFEHGTRLSDGTVIDTKNTDYDSDLTDYNHRYDREMPHIYSTTIVNNEATRQGGGVWYGTSEANVRFNSSVIWQNVCPDQPNVSGIYNITRPDEQTHTTTEYYPFNYCAVHNIKASGLNNIQLADLNKNGTRFHDETKPADRDAMAAESAQEGFAKYAAFGYYGLTNYSVLNRGGMPTNEWKRINAERGLGLDTLDFTRTSRFIADPAKSALRHNIEIGARAFDKYTASNQLMLRLFVASPEDVDIDAATALMNSGAGAPIGSLREYYAQEGSSFAYPMTKLQDALDYIYHQRGYLYGDTIDTECRGLKEFHANNMAFEIFIGPGTFYPSTDPTGNNNNSVGNTFCIPEGVSLIGGFAPHFATDYLGNVMNTDEQKGSNEKHFYGKYLNPYFRNPLATGTAQTEDDRKAREERENEAYFIAYNVKPIPAATELAPASAVNVDGVAREYSYLADNGQVIRIHHVDKDICNAQRTITDINANSIVEPWELENQTILSGSLEGVENNGVNHIVTILANQAYVGALPLTQGSHDHSDVVNPDDIGYEPHEHGQIIAFDGITFKDGYAHGYKPNSVDDDHKLKYNHGGAVLIDTNRYWNAYNKKLELASGETLPDSLARPHYQHGGFTAAAGIRDVTVLFSRCKFENNIAGYGGAISSNTTLDVINSSFEHNMAKNGQDFVDYAVTVESTGAKEQKTIDVRYPGAGGAIYSTYQVNVINTLFANNEALDTCYAAAPQSYSVLTNNIHEISKGQEPGKNSVLLGGCGGAMFVASKGHFHVLNCNFVRNQANAYPAIYTYNPNRGAQRTDAVMSQIKNYNQALNCIFWGNELNSETRTRYAHPETDGESSGYLFSIGQIVNYGRSNRDERYQATISPTEVAQTIEDLDDEQKYSEQVWFSAYEKNRGKTTNNAKDLRNLEANPTVHIYNTIVNGNDGKHQNCNIEISSENAVNEGPNFVNPSAIAGYAGYLESADWSPARLNSLTDNGWGKIMQKIVSTGNDYTAEFITYASDAEVPTERTLYSDEGAGDYKTVGAYTMMRYLKGNEKYQKTMPLGKQTYMLTTYTDDTGNFVPLYRISHDPNPTQNQTYIDMGVYEYHHTRLEYDTEGDEVDVIWVSGIEKPDNGLPDGSAWSQPTSDLQRAIETLLSSRNGHRKEIRLMDGTFTPTYTIDGMLAFYIDTEHQNSSVVVESNGTDKLYGRGVQSLTIKGGYSYLLNGVRDVEQYPAIIRQQKRTDNDDTNHRWDHLFYVKDPTQRYGASSYDLNNDNGHWKSGADKTVNTFPIQFDGVTLVNDQATKDTKGTAIHYADIEVTNSNSANYGSAITTTPVNVTTRYQDAVEHHWDVIEKPAKLIISKTKIYGNGTHDQSPDDADRLSSSAVYIGTNGGHAILYNNDMHSNYGAPLVSRTETHTVNNTFALNGGAVDLGAPTAAKSTIRNSVLWRNNFNKATQKHGVQFLLDGFDHNRTKAVATGEVFVDAAQAPEFFSHNAFTGGDTLTLDYTPGAGISKNHGNVGLIDNNKDFIYSPHFVDPHNPDFALRNFSLLPSFRLLHKGDDQLYDTLAVTAAPVPVVVSKDDGTTETKMMHQIAEPDKNPFYAIYDLAYEPSFGVDAAHKARRVSTIDLGAYEYQNTLSRVIYVDPNKRGGDGKDWEHALGLGNLQDAINLAALYNVNNQTKQAYVFVKGAQGTNKDLHTGEEIILRSGVSVYGGIYPLLTDTCGYKLLAGGERDYGDDHTAAYVKKIRGHHEGHIGPNTNKTTILGIKTHDHTVYNQDTPHIFTLAEGFHVTARTTANPTGTITAPIIDIAPKEPLAKVALCNIVVSNNNISATPGGSIARVKNALIYESFFHTNSVPEDGTVISLEDDGWMVSSTSTGRVATKPTGETAFTAPYNGHGNTYGAAIEMKNRIVNSLVNFNGEDASVTDTLITAQTKYTFSGWTYRRSNMNMYFQLSEGSKHINEIAIAPGTAGNEFLPERLRHFVNYASDRDLLGNPRLLTLVDTVKKGDATGTHYLDRGAFETWKVEKDTRAMTQEHFTPHTGSVVYLMDNVNFVCGTEFQPGFLLVKEGSSLFGNGHAVKVSFLSVERWIDPEGTVMSLPFDMDYSVGRNYSVGVAMPTYRDAPENQPTRALGELILTSDPGSSIMVYDATRRAEWNHTFNHTDADCWHTPAGTKIPANTGVFFKPSDDITVRTLYAFTEQGDSAYNFIYEEDSTEVYKEIKLTQHDDRQATQLNGNQPDNVGASADFTTQENMGWNCIGLPYLVCNYETHGKDYAEAAGAVNEFNLHLPHTLWLYYDGLKTPDGIPVDGDGGFYSVPSWDYTETTDGGVTTNNWHLAAGQRPGIWWGEGIFMQTAAVTGEEQMRFYLPDATGIAGGSKGYGSSNRRYYAVNAEMEEDLTGKLHIGVRGRTAFVRGLIGGERIALYDTAGRYYGGAIAAENRDEWTFALPEQGVYVITVDGKSTKVIAK